LVKILDAQKELFDNLRRINADVVEDGVVDEDEYLSTSPRIMYVLKEVNGGRGWNLCDFIREGGRPATWDNIARWTEAVIERRFDKPWSYWSENNEERRRKYLKKICSINLKKTSGGHTSNGKVIADAALSNAEILKRQTEICHPQLIVCGGTGDEFVDNVIPEHRSQWKSTSRDIWYICYDGKLLIGYLHPEARVKSSILFYSFTDAIQEIFRDPDVVKECKWINV
jgi:hypothetical protein